MAALTPAELAELQLKIKQAEKAYHALHIGSAVRVFTDQNGERVEYTRASRADLAAYIRDLKSQLPNPPKTPVRRPLRFNFP